MKFHIKHAARVLAAILTMTILTGLAPAALAEDTYAMVTATGAKIYAGSDLSGPSAKVPKFTILTLTGTSGDIAQVTWRGKTGYISASLLSAIDTSSPTKATFQTDGKVFEYPSSSSRFVKVPAGTEVNVIMTSGSRLLIERDGCLGYTLLKYLKPASDAGDDLNPDVTYDKFEANVTTDSLNVYASPSASGDLLGKLPKDTVVTVTAYTDTWAYITYKGNSGYCVIEGLEKYTAPDDKPSDDKPNDDKPNDDKPNDDKPSDDNSSIDTILDSSSYSNEQKIYLFLTKAMGFNSAAACGVLANIDCESGFRPTASNSSGSYGICQWLGGRKTKLTNYCSNNGYDSATIKGQLYFLKNELETGYAGVLSSMKSTDDSAQGAYDAGYYWCYYFEIPASRSSSSVKRGTLARDNFWPEYNK